MPWVAISGSVLMLVSTCIATVRNCAGRGPPAGGVRPDPGQAVRLLLDEAGDVGARMVLLDLRLAHRELHDVAHFVRLHDGEGVARSAAAERADAAS